MQCDSIIKRDKMELGQVEANILIDYMSSVFLVPRLSFDGQRAQSVETQGWRDIINLENGSIESVSKDVRVIILGPADDFVITRKEASGG